MRETYLRFLSLAQALDGASVPTVDETAKHLLQLIALRQAQGNALTVTEAMAMSEVASPATIHRKLEDLKSKGLVRSEFHEGNMRTKYLVPSRLANQRYDRLHREMHKSLRSS